MVRIRNVHRRTIADPVEVERKIGSLATGCDELWPHQRWPALRFDRPLAKGARGGHGPIRYEVTEVSPRRIAFRFTPPSSGLAAGLEGSHVFELHEPLEADDPAEGREAFVTHTIEGDIRGWMLLKWPLIIRPLHDALIEDALARAACVPMPAHSFRVRMLRRLARGPRRL